MGHQEIRCHRAVLSAASPVFKGMMSGDWEESMQTLERLDVSAKDMSLLLEYIYVGYIPIEVDCTTLMRLAEFGDYYQLPGLIDQCASRIPPSVHEGNVVEVLSSLSVLSQTNSKLETVLYSVMEGVKTDSRLLYVVCTSLNKPVTWGTDTSADCAGSHDSTHNVNSTPLDEPALLEHQKSMTSLQRSQNNSETHDAVCPADSFDIRGTSDLSCQSRDVAIASQCPSMGDRSVQSCPPGLTLAAQPESEKVTSEEGNVRPSDGSALDENVVGACLSGNSMSSAEDPSAQLTLAQAGHSTEPSLQAGEQQRCPRRKTRRGGKNGKHSVGLDQTDLNSIPDTYNSWD